MTITINRNLLIFVLALVALLALGYFIGTQVGKSGTPAASVVVTATLPAAAAQAPDAAAAQAPDAAAAAPTTEPDLAPRIDAPEFKADYDAKKDMMIVDVRVPEAYAAGHIVGAVNIPEAEVPNRLAELPKDRHIVLYCACPAEQESGRVGTMLMQQGYSPELVKVFRGGYISWNSLGYPIATAPAVAGSTPGVGAIQVQPVQPGQPPVQVVPAPGTTQP